MFTQDFVPFLVVLQAEKDHRTSVYLSSMIRDFRQHSPGLFDFLCALAQFHRGHLPDEIMPLIDWIVASDKRIRGASFCNRRFMIIVSILWCDYMRHHKLYPGRTHGSSRAGVM